MQIDNYTLDGEDEQLLELLDDSEMDSSLDETAVNSLLDDNDMDSLLDDHFSPSIIDPTIYSDRLHGICKNITIGTDGMVRTLQYRED